MMQDWKRGTLWLAGPEVNCKNCVSLKSCTWFGRSRSHRNAQLSSSNLQVVGMRWATQDLQTPGLRDERHFRRVGWTLQGLSCFSLVCVWALGCCSEPPGSWQRGVRTAAALCFASRFVYLVKHHQNYAIKGYWKVQSLTKESLINLSSGVEHSAQ